MIYKSPNLNSLFQSFHSLKPLKKDTNQLKESELKTNKKGTNTKNFESFLEESEYEDCLSHISTISTSEINNKTNNINENIIEEKRGKYKIITSPNDKIHIPKTYYTDDENELKFIELINENNEPGNTNGWEKIIEDNTVTVYMKKVLLDDENKTPSCILKTFANFPFNINVLSSFMEDFEFRSRFEVMLSKGHIIEERKKINNYLEIEYDYFYLKFPWPLNDRDFVEEKKSFHNYAGINDTKVFLLKSTTHPLEPEKIGVTRGNLIINGTFLRKINDNLTEFKSIAQLDIRINSNLAMKLMFSQAPKGQRDWVHETIKKLPEYIQEKGL